MTIDCSGLYFGSICIFHSNLGELLRQHLGQQRLVLEVLIANGLVILILELQVVVTVIFLQ